MRLKKVEIAGFKSFLERAKLVFQPGITAIVGPNGCGKSNIVDAILWAMGEQSAKSLRGTAMEDVIFNGTQNREPTGLAEVNLLFDARGNGPAQFKDSSEIMVTRRLHRSGESEYLLNKTPCRLRDILELFMDTGLGAKAYSIVKQGKIDTIINAKPEELRVFLEEAAGISKYKSRKKAAQRKMEATQDNLTRLRDIIGELERQLSSLDRQAKKAQRYKQYKEEMRDLEIGVSSQGLFDLQRELEERENQLRSLKDEETALAAGIEADEARLEAQRANRTGLEKEIQRITEQHYKMQTRAQEMESQIQILSGNIESIRELRKRGEDDIRSCTDKIDALERQSEALEQTRRALTMEVASGDADLETREIHLQEARRRIDELRTSQEQMVNKQTALTASLERSRQELKERQERLAEFEERLGEKKISKTLLLQELENIRQTSFDFSKTLEELIRSRDELTRDLTAEMDRLGALKREHDDMESRLDELRQAFSRQSSRFDSLRELEEKLEGYDQGVRSIMLEKENREGIRGLVADIFQPAPEYEKALEAVLGPRLQYIIVQSHERGVEAIDYLKTHASGRSSFIPLEMKAHEPAPMPEIYADRIIGHLGELVETAPEYERIARYLLDDVVVVEDLRLAVELWRSNGHCKTLVTLDGEVVDPVGIITGGDPAGTGILEKRREIRDLEGQVDMLKRKMEEAAEACASIEERINDTEGHIEEAKSGFHEREIEILRHEKELERYRNDSDRIRKDLDELAQEETALVREGERLGRRIQELKDEIGAVERAFKDITDLIGKGAETIRAVEARIIADQKTLSDMRVSHAAAKEKMDAIEERVKESAEQIEALSSVRSVRMREIAKGAEDIGDIEVQISELDMSLEKLHRQRLDIESEINEKRDFYEKTAGQLERAEAALKESRRSLNEKRDKLGAMTVGCNELSLKIEHLVAAVDEKYGVDLLEASSKYRIDDYPVEENRQRVNRLKELISRMGEVNLTAISEFEEIRERYEFLSAQQLDLESSIEDLRKAIAKINKTSRQRFKETFEAVNAQFQKLFPRLFKGGRAYIALSESDDILDADVEIVAQPPGKKLQHMALLSGGERAMTAVALIFALFLVKPAPFCVLDEVDGPLDDANIDRFNDIVQEMSKESQFVILTHNKRTMELADTLYGITMEQKGISKLISVKMKKEAVHA